MPQLEIGIRGRRLLDPADLTERVQRNPLPPPTPAAPTITEMLNAFLIQHRLTEPGKAWTGETVDDTVDLVGHGYDNGDRVVIYSLTGGSGLVDGGTYYVYNRADDSFQLVEYPGGDPVDFGNDVTGGTVARWFRPDVNRVAVYMDTSTPVAKSQSLKIVEFSVNVANAQTIDDIDEQIPGVSFPVYDGADRYLAVTAISEGGAESPISATVGPYNADDGSIVMGAANSVVYSGTYDGTWDSGGLNLDATTGWAMDWLGNCDFHDGNFRGVLGDLTINGVLTFGTGGYMRTTSSGQRIEIGYAFKDRIDFYSGHASETTAAFIQASSNPALTLRSTQVSSDYTQILMLSDNISVSGTISFANTVTVSASGGLDATNGYVKATGFRNTAQTGDGINFPTTGTITVLSGGSPKVTVTGSAITLAQATTISAGGLTVTGNSTFNNDLTVSGACDFNGSVSLGTSVGAFTTTGAITLGAGISCGASGGSGGYGIFNMPLTPGGPYYAVCKKWVEDNFAATMNTGSTVGHTH